MFWRRANISASAEAKCFLKNGGLDFNYKQHMEKEHSDYNTHEQQE